jgi:class 3 adenylate cyclase
MDDAQLLSRQAQALVDDFRKSGEHTDNAARLKVLDRACSLYRRAGDRAGQADVLLQLGNVSSNMADYVAALDFLREAGELATSVNDEELASEVSGHLSALHATMGDFSTALRLAQAEWERWRSSPGVQQRLFSANLLGCVLVDAGRAGEGIGYLRESHALVDEIEPASRRAHIRAQSFADIALALLALKRPGEALAAAQEGAAVARAMPHEPLVAQNLLYAGRAALQVGQAQAAATHLETARDIGTRLAMHELHRQALFDLAAAQAALGLHEAAYANHVAAFDMEKSTRREEAFRRAEFLRARAEIDRTRNERDTADRLLFSVLPAPIAIRMRDGESPIADDLPHVSVLFADLVGFTALSTRLPPRELLVMLERTFGSFDEHAVSLGLEKIKTIGDAYLVVGGALDQAPDHLGRCAQLAFRMIDSVDVIARETGLPLSLRVGLHVGPAIAGVIGSQRLAYDVWGETVNLASRLESSGQPGRVHMLADVAGTLADRFDIETRPPVSLKGIGEVATAFLSRR